MSVQIVAELGQNTNGDLDTALRMVEAAAEAGCDAVKVQAYDVGDFLPEGHPDWEMFERGRLDWKEIDRLADAAHARGLRFGGTPTSLDWVYRLVGVGADFLKNGSDFLLRHDLIYAMLDTGLPTWVSTGMASKEEIVAVPSGAKLMLCTSLYPCPDDQANLLRLDCFDGFSDHTEGTVAAVMAATIGVEMIEKHFTLGKGMAGPDHAFSADPAEMAGLVKVVRRTEQMLGDGELGYLPSEQANRDAWRVREGTLRSG